MKKTPPNLLASVLDPSIPLEHRRMMLIDICADPSPPSTQTITTLLEAAASSKGDVVYEKKVKELEETLSQLEQGPLRPGTFLRPVPMENGPLRASIGLSDGSTVFSLFADANLAAQLRRGDGVLLDAQGKAVLRRFDDEGGVGEEARFERRLDACRIEVSLRDHERHVFHASAALLDKIDAGQVSPGAKLVVSVPRMFAFDALPPEDGLSHYRYLVSDPVPDVVPERDIGCPHPCIEEVADHVRSEMLDPESGRRYRIQPSVMKLLVGVSGTGKTYSIQGLWRRIYEIMSEVTGVPVDELPPRVLRLRMSTVLSMWLGESDKQLDRFFDEVEQLACTPFTAPDGTTHFLPLLVLGEEFESIARTRGLDHESTFDRIQTTLLQRLDPTSRKTIANKLIIFLFSSNVPQVIDPAMLRRAGGTIETFGRLNRRAFLAVLEKQLRDRPISAREGKDPAAARRKILADTSAFLFSPNGPDHGQVEISFVGSTHPTVKFQRDFLTPALVERAVQEASVVARREEREGCEDPGLTSEGILKALQRQVRGIVDQLSEFNAGTYLTLPDGARVAGLRRLAQPEAHPLELRRAS
jgi:ATP-dependent 26S proteasome regulatory subunit